MFVWFFFGPKACGILAPWPGIEPAPPTVEGEILTTGPPGKSLTRVSNTLERIASLANPNYQLNHKPHLFSFERRMKFIGILHSKLWFSFHLDMTNILVILHFSIHSHLSEALARQSPRKINVKRQSEEAYKQLKKEEKWKAKEKWKDIPIWMQSSKE